MTGNRRSKIDQEIGRMADLSGAELVASWRKMFKAPPPKGIKRGLLERARAYRLQVRAFGGLKPASRKRLLAIAEGRVAESEASRANVDDDAIRHDRAKLKPGARLIREWNGVVHTVDVVDGGFLWNGRNWKSLSAVAEAITGARWSGPRFFGL
jgi:hypothetical protein